MYLDEFKEAVNRTNRFKLQLPAIVYSNTTYLTDQANTDIPRLLLEEIGRPNLDKIVAQCFSFHSFVKNIFEKYFKVPVTYTIGWVYEPPNSLFKQTEEQLLQLLESGPNSLQINLHAWLTLPSMEIIDLTLPTTVAAVRGQKVHFGGAISGHPDKFTGGLKYHPMLVGDDYFRKLGVLIEFSFGPR